MTILASGIIPGGRTRNRRPGSRGFISVFAASTAVALALTMALLAAPAAQAIDNGAFGIRPSNGSDFFRLRMAPGAVIDAVAIVTNHTAAPVTLLTYPVDGATTPNGGFVLNARGAPQSRVGLWAQLGSTRVTVPARSETSIPFTIGVPKNALSGDFVGGVVIETLPVDGVADQATGTATRVDVIHRQGVRIYLTVAAADAPRATPGTADTTPARFLLDGETWLPPIAIVATLGMFGLLVGRALKRRRRLTHRGGEPR